MTQPKLLRQLGVFSATAIVVSNMVGTGIFTTTGFLAGDLGSAWLVVAIWFVGAALALAGALCFSEMGINLPRSGGEYVFLTEAWGPIWGFLTGWVSFFAGFSAPTAAAALATSEYLGYFYPALSARNAGPGLSLGFFALHFGPGQLVACGIVAAFTLVNVVGLLRAAQIQNFLTTTKVLVIVAFLGLAVLVGKGDWAHFSMPAARTSTNSVPVQFILSLVWVYFGYSGWNAAAYVAEELRDPERTLPRSLLAGTLLVALLYAGLNVVFIYASPLESMKGVIGVGAHAAGTLFGPAVAGTFSGLMAFSLLSTVSAMTIIGPRVYYAMASNRAFFRIAERVHPRWKTPWIAVLAQGACCCLLIVTGTFSSLVQYIGFSLWFFTALTVLGMFRLRRRPGWKPLAAANLAFPLIPGVYVASAVWVLSYMVWRQPKESGYGLLTMAVGALLWMGARRWGLGVGD
ncbi:MAG: amino acid permease [Acidobacteria bacterium]|nr:amino acid permease [Acidobacteriota bacterium]